MFCDLLGNPMNGSGHTDGHSVQEREEEGKKSQCAATSPLHEIPNDGK